MQKNKNSEVAKLLKECDYEIRVSASVIDDKPAVQVVFPPNKIVFPTMHKVTNYYILDDSGLIFVTPNCQKNIELRLPLGWIRPIIDIDIRIMADALGYSHEYIVGDVHEALDIKLSDKDKEVEGMIYEVLAANDNIVFPLSLGYFLQERLFQLGRNLV